MMTVAGNMLLMAICSRRAGATKKILFTFTVHSGFHFIFPKNKTHSRTASVKKMFDFWTCSYLGTSY